MPTRRVAKELNAGTFFLTLTIQRWHYLFDRHNRWQILAESLRYCREHKELELNGYVFMLNPVHLIATAPDMAGFLRDFKRFTSVKFKRNLESTEPNVLPLFWMTPATIDFGKIPICPRKSRTRISIDRSSITFTRIR